eukprot:10746044-Karenia_brevis.AAC.1
MGWPPDVPNDHVVYLQSPGVPHESAEFIAVLIDGDGPRSAVADIQKSQNVSCRGQIEVM